MNEIATRGKPWQKGITGNPNGRPVGSRSAFSNAFLEDLSQVWAEHGKASMIHTARLNPEVFFATCARILPKDVQLTLQAQAPTIDETDLAILRAIKEAIPGAGSREPGDVFNTALEAIRAHSAKQIDCVEKPSPNSPIDDQ